MSTTLQTYEARNQEHANLKISIGLVSLRYEESVRMKSLPQLQHRHLLFPLWMRDLLPPLSNFAGKGRGGGGEGAQVPDIEDNEYIVDPANGADAVGLATALVIEVSPADNSCQWQPKFGASKTNLNRIQILNGPASRPGTSEVKDSESGDSRLLARVGRSHSKAFVQHVDSERLSLCRCTSLGYGGSQTVEFCARSEECERIR